MKFEIGAHLMRPFSVNGNDKTDAARLPLESRIVQSLLRRQGPRLGVIVIRGGILHYCNLKDEEGEIYYVAPRPIIIVTFFLSTHNCAPKY